MSLVVRINGAMSFVLDQELETKKSFIDKINEWADKIVQAEINLILTPLYESIKSFFQSIINALNSNSSEIISFSVISCAIGMILAPLMGSTSARWFGRVIFVMIVGVVWRLMIT